MDLTKKEIAELFSNGKFDQIIDFLSEEIVWNVIGEKTFEGKKDVVENCIQIAEYFKSVQTIFKTEEVVVDENKVIVFGTAEFRRNDKRINFISACDLYLFNNRNKIEKISSYCITEKNNNG
ncbi:nuclear transport factor 2 family protein [Namhaeicola litoreus]|uniref:Nuclear transport factor 2 family protein n=1 Tax=Namhaeicola litoreus TaxID=1052145 RepID=A0ABW3Y1M6_9FLAO